jgi:hypothetical protein
MLVLISVVLIFFSGYIAHKQFKLGNSFLGWSNLLASAMNLAAVMIQIL